MNDYLWDRGGPHDEEIAELERTLAPLRYRRRLDTSKLPKRRTSWRAFAAIAAGIVLILTAWQLERASERQRTSWTVTDTKGAPSRLYAGQVLRTGASSKLMLESEDIGQVDLEPNSNLRVIESRAGRQRMNLEQGKIHALIWAPPRQFVVDTPSSRAIDLGCEYTLSVDAAGDGLVKVETGWVAFQFGKQESFIPAGAACRTRKRTGPGVPYYEDASTEFKQALSSVENIGGPDSLNRVLTAARAKDALSLWHLFTRVPEHNRHIVFERFAQLVKLPPQVNAAGIIAGDSHMLDLCWNALELDDADWWREWKREWKP